MHIFIAFAFGQQTKLDSLIKITNSKAADSIRLNAFVNILNMKMYEPQAEVKPFFEKGMKLANLQKNELAKANLFQNYAITFAVANLYDSSLVYFEKARFFYEKINDKDRLSKVYSNIAGAYRFKGFYRLSILNNLKSLSLRETLNDTIAVAKALNDLASTYLYMEDYQNALTYALKAKNVFNQLEVSNHKIANLIALGSVYEKIEKLDSALYYNELAEKLCLQNMQLTTQKYSLAHIYNNLGTIQRAKQNYEQSISYSLKCIAYFDTLQSHVSSKFNPLENMAECYRLKKDYKQAEVYLSLAEKAIEGLGLLEEEKFLALEKSKFYEATNDYRKAFEYFETYKLLEDSILNTKTKNTVAEYQIIYETEKKDKRILKLALENEQKQSTILQLILFSAVIGVLVLIVLVLIYVLSKRRERMLVLKIQENEKKHNFLYFHELGNKMIAVSKELQQFENAKTYDFINSLGNEIRHFSHQQNSPNLKNINAKDLINQIYIDYKGFINGQLVLNNMVSDKKWKSLKHHIQLAIYRSVQELWLNAAKHADASLIKTSITQVKQSIQILYQDNGKGTESKSEQGKGIGYLTDLIHLFKGTITIETEPNKGFLCIIEIPANRFF